MNGKPTELTLGQFQIMFIKKMWENEKWLTRNYESPTPPPREDICEKNKNIFIFRTSKEF